jgi:hypothetical protein
MQDKGSKLLDERLAQHVTGRVTERVASYIEQPTSDEALGTYIAGIVTAGRVARQVSKFWGSRWETYWANDKALGKLLGESLLGKLLGK